VALLGRSYTEETAMPDCSTCYRTAKFRLDAYDTSDFPTTGQGWACREHLASTVIALEEQLGLLDDTDALCVSVLDEPTTAELTDTGKQRRPRPARPGTSRVFSR